MSDIKKQIKDFNFLSHLVGTDNILLQRENGTSFRSNVSDILNFNKPKDYTTAGLAYTNSLNYQTVQVIGSNATHRPKLNFSSQFLFVDNTGNDSTDIGINTIGWDKITSTPTTLEGYGITSGGIFIEIVKNDLITAIANNTLIPFAYYAVTDSQYESPIIVQALTPHDINPNGKWLRVTNLLPFGSISFQTTGSGTDSVVKILLNETTNILTQTIYFHSTINQTIRDVATNINNGTSGYRALAINTSLLLIGNTFTSSSVTLSGVTTGSISGAGVRNIENGQEVNEIMLDIVYDPINDLILSCTDNLREVTLKYSYNYLLGENGSNCIISMINFRWYDNAFSKCKFSDTILTDVYVTGSYKLRNVTTSESIITNYYSDGYTTSYLNVSNNSQLTNINLLSSTLSNINLDYTTMNSNIIADTTLKYLNSSNQSLITNNVFESSNVSYVVLEDVCTINNNGIIGTTIVDFNLKYGAQLTNNTFVSSTTLTHITILYNSTFQNSYLYGSNINELNILTGEVVFGYHTFSNSSLNKITLNKQGINFTSLELPTSLLSNVSDIIWDDQSIKYTIIKNNFNGLDGNGLVNTDILLAPIIPIKSYVTRTIIDTPVLNTDNGTCGISIGFDDNIHAINSFILVSILAGTTIFGNSSFQKTSTSNQFIRMRPTFGSILSGSIKIIVELSEGA